MGAFQSELDSNNIILKYYLLSKILILSLIP